MWGNGGNGNQYSDQVLEKQIRDCLVQGDPKRRVMSDCKTYVRELVEMARDNKSQDDENGSISAVVKKCPPVSTNTYKSISSILGTSVTDKNQKRIMQLCYMIEKVSGLISEVQTVNKATFIKFAQSIIDDDCDESD